MPRVQQEKITSAMNTAAVCTSAIAAESSDDAVSHASTMAGPITFAFGPIRNSEAPSSRTEEMKISSQAATIPGSHQRKVTVRI